MTLHPHWVRNQPTLRAVVGSQGGASGRAENVEPEHGEEAEDVQEAPLREHDARLQGVATAVEPEVAPKVEVDDVDDREV